MGEKEFKCVVWDLDNTLWDGVLLESPEVTLKPGVVDVIKTLDQRGILLSIASKNDHEHAMERLREWGLADYFLYPQINWGAKSASLEKIRASLNIGMDAMLFLDDQPFELEEVKHVHPAATCWLSTEYADDYRKLLDHPRLNPRFITQDSARRRLMYLQDQERQRAEQEYQGPKEEFFASLQMKFVISRAREEDLQRAEELTVRTNQLNATGRIYSYDELNAIRLSESHRLYICELTDRLGSYGKIGLMLVETTPEVWHLRLLLMSCRVMSRGVGTVLLSFIMSEAKKAGARLLADFVDTGRNRMMYVTYKFANFVETGTAPDGTVILENDLSKIQPFPPYVDVRIEVG